MVSGHFCQFFGHFYPFSRHFRKTTLHLTYYDFVFLLGTILGQEFLRGILVRRLNPMCFWDLEHGFPGYAEFNLPDNILHLIYNQGISWMGLYFCPGLSAVFIVKLILLMYRVVFMKFHIFGENSFFWVRNCHLK